MGEYVTCFKISCKVILNKMPWYVDFDRPNPATIQWEIPICLHVYNKKSFSNMSPDPLTGPLCTVRQDCQPVVSQSATDENFVLFVQWWDFNVVVQDDAPKMLLRWNTSNCSGLMLTDRWEKTTTHQQEKGNILTTNIFGVKSNQISFYLGSRKWSSLIRMSPLPCMTSLCGSERTNFLAVQVKLLLWNKNNSVCA